MVTHSFALTLGAIITAWVLGPTGAKASCLPPPANMDTGRAHSVTPDDLARLRDIGTPDPSAITMPSPLAISPDGSAVAFVLSQGNPQTNTYCRMLLVADIKTGAVPRIVDQGGEFVMVSADVRGLLVPFGLAATVTPAWSPDGRSLGYLRRDHGVTQLWHVDIATGVAKPVTRATVDIEQWVWTSNDQMTISSRPGQLAVRIRDATEGQKGWHYDARFSPAYAASPQMRGTVPPVIDTIDLRTGAIRGATRAEIAQLIANGAGTGNGTKIVGAGGATAWLNAGEALPSSPARLYSVDAGGKETSCTASACLSDIVRLFWNADGRSVSYLRREGWAKSQMAFYRWSPGLGKPERLWITNDVLLGCLPHGLRLLCLRETSTSPRHIVDLNPETGVVKTIYDPNPETNRWQFGTVERLTWVNDRGIPAWGDLVLPPKRKSGQTLPLIVVQYHSLGFLRGGTGDEYPIFALAARGFAVLSIEAPIAVGLTLPHLGNWDAVNRAGLTDWSDRRSQLSSMLTGISRVRARGLIDPRRIGITGVSDGATSARFALINSHVFSAAAISSSSLEPKTAMTYGGIAWADFNRVLGYPRATDEVLAFWKPASLALNASTLDVPLLIQASDDEYLLALETFTALREYGKPVDMFVFPDEHHIKWQPVHRLAAYTRTIDWFAFWFQGVIDPDPDKIADYARWTTMRASRSTASTRFGSARQP
jgi:dipeptidyl aminopeptidase/acylaminoacyl peptidase